MLMRAFVHEIHIAAALRSLPGEFGGLQLLSCMYVTVKARQAGCRRWFSTVRPQQGVSGGGGSPQTISGYAHTRSVEGLSFGIVNARLDPARTSARPSVKSAPYCA